MTGFTFSVTLKPAHAYLDGASVTYILQMLVATGFMVLFMMKIFWKDTVHRVSRYLEILRRVKTKAK